MRWKEYSHRHGKELLKLLHSGAIKDIKTILDKLDPFPHGEKKGKTVKEHLTRAFTARGWESEVNADFGTDKTDKLDFAKWKVAIEMEFSNFEKAQSLLVQSKSTPGAIHSVLEWLKNVTVRSRNCGIR